MFKIVFKGEIGFDFDPEEVKGNLQRFCRFDRNAVERLFSGGTFVLKKNLSREQADKLREAFQRLGAFVDVVAMPSQDTAPAGAASASSTAPAIRADEPGPFSCPACGQTQTEGTSCVACGVYFAKFARAQERRAREQLNTLDDLSLAAADEPVRQNRTLVFDRWAAQPFLFQCGMLIVGLAVLRALLGPGLVFLGFIILPSAWLLCIMVRAMVHDQGAMDGLGENLDFLWERTEPEERRRQWLPWGTYGIILLDLLLYYSLVVRLDPATLTNSLAFFPAAPNFWNVPLGGVASLFLHADGGQLWGCVAFLWIIGPGVEKRLGRGLFIGLYLLSGVAAGVAGAVLNPLLGQGALHALGSSGAIAGLFGLFVSWREDDTVEFALPFIDLVSFIAPTSVSVRLHALALTGLFFYAYPGAGIVPQNGAGALLIGYFVHVVGLVAGILAGRLVWKALAPTPAAPNGVQEV